MSYLNIAVEDDVAVVELNNPDDKMNTLNERILEEFTECLDRLEKEPLKAVVLISAKKDHFIAGADIGMLNGIRREGQAGDLSRRGQRMLDRLADLDKPVVAAIHGACLGGGMEVALACHYRIASDDPKTVFGQPEVKLGVLPGGGGTQRLPRLVGLQAALDIMLTGKNVYAYKAKKIGLVDQLIHPHGLRRAAVRFALDMAKKPFRRKRKRGLVQRFLEGTPPGRALVFRIAAKTVRKKSGGHYPAPYKILQAVRVGLSAGMRKGLAFEADCFDSLVNSRQSKALMGLFFAMTASKKNPSEKQSREIGRLGILGAGLMGSGIAEVSARNGLTVLLKDVDTASVVRAEKALAKSLEVSVKKRILTPFARDQVLSRVHGMTDYAAFSKADMVIEAVFEDLALKRAMLADIESNAPETCIFASNTSSLPIADIAAHAQRPEQVVGMHYFSPVPKMPLLEIIVTDRTADWVRATAVAVGIRQGKNTIVVKDGPGFYTTRILAPLLNEAVALLKEGAAVEDIDRAMTAFGFPVGPAALMDEVGIDVGAHVSEVLGPLFKKRGVEPDDTIKALDEAGYKGRKNAKGFYRYPTASGAKNRKKKKEVNREIYRFFGGSARKPMPPKEIQERLLLIMVNEAALCLQDEILSSPRDGDLGAVLGLGFPPFLGGPFWYMDMEKPDKIHARIEALFQKHGPRFRPAPIIADHAKKSFRQAAST